MQLEIYPRLGTNSKKAMAREAKAFGKPYRYIPRYDLVQRLAKELNWSENQVRQQIIQERRFILEHRKYFY